MINQIIVHDGGYSIGFGQDAKNVAEARYTQYAEAKKKADQKRWLSSKTSVKEPSSEHPFWMSLGASSKETIKGFTIHDNISFLSNITTK